MFDDVVSNATQEVAAPAAQNTPPQAPTDVEFLERFNKLSSRDATLRKQQQEIRSERDSFKAKIERLERLEKLAQENPEDLLSEFGTSYDKLTERRLSSMGGEQDKVVSSLQSRLEQLEAKLSQQSKIEAEQKTTQSMQAAQSEIRKICESDDFELIRSQDAYDLVLDVAAEAYAKGRHITLAEAAKYTEAHLESKLERLLQAKKVTSRISPKPKAEDTPEPQQAAQQSSSLNSQSFSASSRPAPNVITEDDLRQAALRALRGG